MAKAADLRQAMSASARTAPRTPQAEPTPAPVKLAKAGKKSQEPAPEDNPHYRPGRATKSNVTGYFPPEVKKQLRMLAAEKDTTIQGLLAEAINGLFAAHGKPEIAPLEGN
jgi:hypothetical protein